MLEETLARLRTHHKNVQRYRQLLESGLTDFEREYIGKRLSEEQASIDGLCANIPDIAMPLAQGNQQVPLAAAER